TDIEPRGLYFELAGEEARAIARDVGNAVASYCKEASRLGLGNAEIEQEAISSRVSCSPLASRSACRISSRDSIVQPNVGFMRSRSLADHRRLQFVIARKPMPSAQRGERFSARHGAGRSANALGRRWSASLSRGGRSG